MSDGIGIRRKACAAGAGQDHVPPWAGTIAPAPGSNVLQREARVEPDEPVRVPAFPSSRATTREAARNSQ